MIKKASKFNYQSHYEHDANRVNMLTGISPWRKYRDLRRFQVIFNYFPRRDGIAVLDVGSGDGRFLEMGVTRGFKMFGLEISKKRVARAKKFLKSHGVQADVFVGDINKLPFKKGAFDVVVASEVVEHTLDPGRAVLELARVAKPGGTIIVTVPYKEQITFEQCVHCGKFTPKAGHLHSFDAPKLIKILKKVGLKNITHHVCVPRMTPFWKIGRRIPYSIWRIFDMAYTYLGDKADLTPLRANWILVRGER